MQHLAGELSLLTGAPLVENNVTDLWGNSSVSAGQVRAASVSRAAVSTGATGSRQDDAAPTGNAGHTAPASPTTRAGHTSPAGADYAVPQDDLPPFLRDRIGDVVHTLDVDEKKLARKGNPYRVKIADEVGQKFLNLIIPLVTHLVNEESFERARSALVYLGSDRDDTYARAHRIRILQDCGWRDEEELLDTLALVYDAQSGPVPGANANRDSFERYYMALRDRVRVPAVRYRILFFELMETIIAYAPERMNRYEEEPDSLTTVQNSQNYAMRFIVNVAAVVIVGFALVFAGIIVGAFLSGIAAKLVMVAVAADTEKFRKVT